MLREQVGSVALILAQDALRHLVLLLVHAIVLHILMRLVRSNETCAVSRLLIPWVLLRMFRRI